METESHRFRSTPDPLLCTTPNHRLKYNTRASQLAGLFVPILQNAPLRYQMNNTLLGHIGSISHANHSIRQAYWSCGPPEIGRTSSGSLLFFCKSPTTIRQIQARLNNRYDRESGHAQQSLPVPRLDRLVQVILRGRPFDFSIPLGVSINKHNIIPAPMHEIPSIDSDHIGKQSLP